MCIRDRSRPSQLGTELGRSKSPRKVCRKIAPVAESESSDVVAIGLDRPCSDDVQVNISSSSLRDEGHQNVFVTESEVGSRSSEVKVPQVEQEVVMGDLQSTPPIDTADAKIAFKSTAGMVTYEHTTQTNGRHLLTYLLTYILFFMVRRLRIQKYTSPLV